MYYGSASTTPRLTWGILYTSYIYCTATLLQKQEAPNPVFRELGRESKWMAKGSPSSHRLTPARQQIRLLLEQTFCLLPSSIVDLSHNFRLYLVLISCSSLSGMRALNRGLSAHDSVIPPLELWREPLPKKITDLIFPLSDYH